MVAAIKQIAMVVLCLGNTIRHIFDKKEMGYIPEQIWYPCYYMVQRLSINYVRRSLVTKGVCVYNRTANSHYNLIKQVMFCKM